MMRKSDLIEKLTNNLGVFAEEFVPEQVTMLPATFLTALVVTCKPCLWCSKIQHNSCISFVANVQVAPVLKLCALLLNTLYKVISVTGRSQYHSTNCLTAHSIDKRCLTFHDICINHAIHRHLTDGS